MKTVHASCVESLGGTFRSPWYELTGNEAARLMPGNGWASLRRGRVPGRAAHPSGGDVPGVEGGNIGAPTFLGWMSTRRAA